MNRIRIIAGELRGRRLGVPRGEAVRPTSERAREALFNILVHRGPGLEGVRFLDLFAGTGAVGIEALSRGAAEVVLVENGPEALPVLRANLERLPVAGRVRLLETDATLLGRAPRPFDLVFLDPPYRSGLAAPTLARLVAGDWIAPGGQVIVELPAREPFRTPPAFDLEDERRYGSCRFLFLRPARGVQPDS